MTHTRKKGETLVRHIKSGVFGGVLIDRRTKWGNPFKIEKGVRTREQAIAAYREYINDPKQAALKARIVPELKDEILLCWCPPKACHGDVLAAIANGEEV